MGLRAVLRNQLCGRAGERRYDQCLGVKLTRSGDRSCADSIGNICIGALIDVAHLILCVVEELLGILDDGRHHIEGLDRILAGCGLTRQHDSVGSVINRICNVGHFRSRRTRITDHGIEHLGCGDDELACEVTLVDHLLLELRETLRVDLHTEVATGHHDTIGGCDDGIEVIQALLRLDLRDDLHAGACLVDQCTNLLDGLRITHEGSGYEIEALFDTELDVLDILLGQARKANAYVRNIDTLLLTELAAVCDEAVDVRTLDALHLEADQAIIDQDGAALLDVFIEPVIVNVYTRCISDALVDGQDDFVARLEHHLLVVLELTGTNLRSLRVKQRGDLTTGILACLLQQRETAEVLLVAAMGEVETCHVHLLCELLHQLVIVLIRSKCTYNLRLSHKILLFLEPAGTVSGIYVKRRENRCMLAVSWVNVSGRKADGLSPDVRMTTAPPAALQVDDFADICRCRASAEIPHVIDVSVLRSLIRQKEEQRDIQQAHKDRHLVAEARKGHKIE